MPSTLPAFLCPESFLLLHHPSSPWPLLLIKTPPICKAWLTCRLFCEHFHSLIRKPAVLESISRPVTGPGPSSLTASDFGSPETAFSLLHCGNCKLLEGRVWGWGWGFHESSLNPFPTITLPVLFTSPQGNSKVGCEKKKQMKQHFANHYKYKLRSSAPFLPIFFLDSCPSWLWSPAPPHPPGPDAQSLHGSTGEMSVSLSL